MIYDVVVIGGGPSGLMAAIAAGEQGGRVLLLDKGDKLGRKLAISGGGRCNVTNRRPVDELIQHIPGNGRFLYRAFSVFNNEDIIRFFERLGVPLKEEDHGRMFPISDSAQSVVQALLRELKRLGVHIRVHTRVKDIEYKDGAVYGVKLETEEIIRAKAVVVAVGGKSVPHTGSTGDGYAWAEKAGHTITELFPTEVPIISHEPFIQERTLQGLSLRDVALSVLNAKGKRIVTHRMDMIFTHFGVSGPAALRCSQFVVKQLKKQPSVMMTIDALPDDKEEALFQRIVRAIKEEPKKTIKNIVKALLPLPERYILFLLERVAIDPQTTASTLGTTKFAHSSRYARRFLFLFMARCRLKKRLSQGVECQ
ncbi:Fumarate reductase flavoprotein subunit precursor [Anoxybacillus sp. BCO1]|nr:Fumarate reductase flavoprotein subunit precursor [Anoxybacillus sp. BCO1]